LEEKVCMLFFICQMQVYKKKSIWRGGGVIHEIGQFYSVYTQLNAMVISKNLLISIWKIILNCLQGNVEM